MRWLFPDYALLREQLTKAEDRAEAAESALVAERDARMADVRHVLSMWLRHERAVPLPPTPAEKANAEADRAAAANRPRPLTELEMAQREALRQEALSRGLSVKDADEQFHAMRSNLEQ